ncbi:MAG: glycosyltransferase [Deltaproteobacteria bacterium]|nr:glycosyltransferase [Deltaproteobacteria bacterium]
MNEINHRLVVPIVRETAERLGMKDFILWIYQPSASPYIDLLKPALSCYDCVDEYSAMPGAWIQATRAMERKLIKSADAVFTTARSLFEDKKKHNPNTHFVPNVADFEHFNKTLKAKPARDLAGIPKPIIGYVGALNYKIDDGLLDRLFAARPDWSFVFVGPDRGFGIERFIGHRNVHFIGRRSIEEMPEFLAAMDVCLIPYKLDRYTRGVLPMKHYEYLASGRPVVSHAAAGTGGARGLIDLARTSAEFVEAIERRLRHDQPADRKKRIALAKDNSWEKRIRQILSTLEETWKTKNSAA